jgi:hypothetical protein
VQIVRDWLRSTTGAKGMPTGPAIFRIYKEFKKDVPRVYKELRLSADQITFVDYSYIVATWLNATLGKINL